MKRIFHLHPIFCLLMLLAACAPAADVTEDIPSPTAVPVTRMEAEELPSGTEPEGLPGPSACTPLPEGMTLTATAPDVDTVDVAVTGLQPGERPVIILMAGGEAGSVLDKWQPVQPVGNDGRYADSFDVGRHNEANDLSLTAWQVQVLHARGAACTDVTLPTPNAAVTPTAVPSPAPTPSPEPLATVTSSGRANNPHISANGRFIAFTATGALTENARSDGQLAVFVHDRQSATTHLASVTVDGRPPTDDIYGFALSADGTTVAYYAFDNNLTAGDTCPEDDVTTPCEDLFVSRWQRGETTRIPLGRPTGLGKDYTVALSPDGRFVAYNNMQVLDLQTGQPVSIFPEPPDGHTFAPAFAANGDLAFISKAGNLVPGDTNEAYDVFVWQAETGQITRVSVASDGTEGNDASGGMQFHEGVGDSIAISNDGRYVVFVSLATNLAPDAVSQCDDYRGFTRPCYPIYLHDRETGETRLVVNGDGDSMHPALSADGRFLVFASLATNLVDGVPPCQFPAIINCGMIYRLDMETGAISLLSRTEAGDPPTKGSWRPDISDDGRFVTFVSKANNLVFDDTNSDSDIFLYDVQTVETERISIASERQSE